ncbi:MAG: NAD(+) synthase, partial [Bdellovibrionaceae bacterium]|nr:NAD(+) synthase [Pseudobdellovibrionaceae bacterium]
MRIGLAQINPTMGDIAGNTQKIIDYIERSHEKHCELVVFPELCVLGYNPNDLLERTEVIEAGLAAIKKIKKAIPKKMSVIIGSITSSKKKSTKPFHNSAIVLGPKDAIVSKTLLPSYDIFDEQRFLTPGDPKSHLVRIGGKNVLILICEDIWAWERSEHSNFLNLYKNKKIDLVVSINGSPFALSKPKRREMVVGKTAKYLKAPVVYVNCVGGQDEVIYDGGSFVMSEKGSILAQSSRFSEDLNVVDLGKSIGGKRQGGLKDIQSIQQALVLGLRDFAQKNNFKTLHVGVSGGIDSAVVLALAADAVGPRNVIGIAMPGPFSADESFLEAQKLCKNMGCGFHKIDIKSSYEHLLESFEGAFGEQPFGVLNENIQARLRGLYLMMFSNFKGSLLLSTGNKSEIATGY